MLNLNKEFLSGLSFRFFNEEDWLSFSGCESKNPLIADVEKGAVIIDGEWVSFYNIDSPDDENYLLLNDLI